MSRIFLLSFNAALKGCSGGRRPWGTRTRTRQWGRLLALRGLGQEQLSGIGMALFWTAYGGTPVAGTTAAVALDMDKVQAIPEAHVRELIAGGSQGRRADLF